MLMRATTPTEPARIGRTDASAWICRSLSGDRESIARDRSIDTTTSNTARRSRVALPVPAPTSKHMPSGNGPPRASASPRRVVTLRTIALTPSRSYGIEPSDHLRQPLWCPCVGVHRYLTGKGAHVRRYISQIRTIRLVGYDSGKLRQHHVSPCSYASCPWQHRVVESTWKDTEKVSEYVGRVGRLATRAAGEAELVESLPERVERVLDLGCGDGRLAALVLDARPTVVEAVGLDNSHPMIELARERFRDDPRVVVAEHDLNEPLPPRASSTWLLPASRSTIFRTTGSACCSRGRVDSRHGGSNESRSRAVCDAELQEGFIVASRTREAIPRTYSPEWSSLGSGRPPSRCYCEERIRPSRRRSTIVSVG